MEIHFFDRLKALASLYEYSGDADSKAAAQTLLAALSGGEAVNGDGVKTFSPKQKLAMSWWSRKLSGL